MNNQVLTGVRVIDLTQNVAGPFCSQVLGDLGADVIKVERPDGGDDTRAWMPATATGHSSTFLALNRNKKSICIDFESEAGRDLLRELASSADVFVHALKPGSAERRGFGWDDLKAVNSQLIYCSISAFGSSGPLSSAPGYDPLMQAFTGVMSTTGNEGDEPVRVGVSLIDIGAGMWATIGILSGLLRRAATGEGSNVEASLLDTGVGWMSIFVSAFAATGQLPRKLGSAVAMTAPYELFSAADGSVFVAAGNDRLFRRVCASLGAPELADDARFASNADRVRNREALHRLLGQRIGTLTVKDAVKIFRAAGAPCSELQNVAEMLGHAQIKAAGIVAPLLLGDATHNVVALPVKINGARGDRATPPPALGAATDQILKEIGVSAARLTSLRNDGIIA